MESEEGTRSERVECKNVLCFNPECPSPKNRFFSASDNHFKNEKCRIWLHRIDDLLIYDKYLLSNLKNENGGLLFDFAK